MNHECILIGLSSFLVIGIFHPIVIQVEFRFGKKVWPVFLVLGALCLLGAWNIPHNVIAAMVSITGFTSFGVFGNSMSKSGACPRGGSLQTPKEAALQR